MLEKKSVAAGGSDNGKCPDFCGSSVLFPYSITQGTMLVDLIWTNTWK